MNMRGYGAQLGARLRPLLAQVGDFAIWWRDELLGLMPERWQRHLRHLGNSLIIELDEQQAVFSLGNLAQAEALETLGLEALCGDGGLREASLARAAKAAQIILLLPAQHALRKTVGLPLATEGKVDNVLRFEMDRYTPFSSEQVYFGHRQLRHGGSRERIEIELTVVQRDYLDPLLAALGRLGLAPDLVSLRDSADSAGNLVNLLPASRGLAGRQGWRKRLRVVWVPLLVLGLLAWPFFLQDRELQALQDEVLQLKDRVEQARGLGSTLEQLQSGRDFLLRQQAAAPQPLLLLDELTALLPDSTWLTRFEDDGSSVRLDGESAEASSLISLLESSPLLENVRFASPVTANPGTARERFSLVADVSRSEVQP